MDYQELDEAEKERRKKEAVEFRNRKRNSNLFLFLGSLFEIVVSLIIILALFLFFLAVLSRILPANIFEKVYPITTLISFFGGLFLGFMVYRKLAQFIIEKYKLKDKITDEVYKHYAKLSKEEMEAMKRR